MSIKAGAFQRHVGRPLDAVADCAGHGVLAASLVSIREGGSAGSIVELSGDIEEAIDRNQRLHGVLVHPERETLDRLREAVEHRALRPVVDAVVELDAIVRSHRGLDTGHGEGKVVLRMTDVDALAAASRSRDGDDRRYGRPSPSWRRLLSTCSHCLRCPASGSH